MNIAELDRAFDFGNANTVRRPRIDRGGAVEESFEFLGRLFGFAHVGGEGEDGAGGLGAEDDGGEADEELEHGVFAVGYPVTAVPVDVSNYRRRHRT